MRSTAGFFGAHVPIEMSDTNTNAGCDAPAFSFARCLPMPLLAWMTVIAVVLSAGAAFAGSGPFPSVRTMIAGDGSAGPYRLGFRFIGGAVVPDSSSFNPRGISVAAWDDSAGTITFDRPVPAGDSVAVTAAVPPGWMPDAYRRMTAFSDSGGQRIPADYTSERERIPRSFPGLRFGGSKTFNVNVGGGREAALNQALELNISGRLADDLTLNALISDRNIPITPEGNTRELDELDRVLIELRGKHFTADMGDTDLNFNGGRWLSWSRRLSGARIGVNAGGASLFGSGAVSEGRFMSAAIAPVEGNQGPYRLAASDGRRDISVVPGTERLWINGERLIRGESDDYTVDYTTGEVIFTGKRIIGSDMRIVADYEYTSESFRRTFYSGGGDATFFGGGLTIGAAAAREADDVSRPVLAELDAAARHELSLAGDSPAMANGVRSAVGDSTGSYDLADGRLVFNPLGKGKYNATFSWVGADRGSYRYSGGGVYEFVPPGGRIPGSGASYEPVASIPAPASHTIAGIRVAAKPLPSFAVEAELAGSSLDRNTLSSRDDSDNNGGAYRATAAFSPEVRIAVPLKANLSASIRSSGETFRPLDRDRTAEENRRWGIPLITPPGREETSEYGMGATVAGGKFLGTGISLDTGRAEYGDSTASRRAGLTGLFSYNRRMEGKVTVHRISREGFAGFADGDIGRIEGEFHGDLRGFAPSLAYERERIDPAGTRGSLYDDFRVRLRSPESPPVRGEAEWYYRRDRIEGVSRPDSALTRGVSAGIEIGGAGSGSLKLTFSRRQRIAGGSEQSGNQAQIDGSWNPEHGGASIEGSYRGGTMREASKRKNFLYYGEGRGGYRWEDTNGDGVRDPEEFIPDEHGPYFLYEEPLDDYRPVNSVHAVSRARFDLFGGSGTPQVRSETSVEIDEKSSAPAASVLLLDLRDFRKRGKTLSGDARFQEDITLPGPRGGSLRVRLFRLDSYRAEFVSGAERRGEEEESLRLRLPLAEASDAEFTVTRAFWSRLMEERSAGDFRIASYSGDAAVSWYPRPSATVSLSAGGGFDRDRASGIRTRFAVFKPGYTHRLSGSGRIETSYTFTAVGRDGGRGGATLPYPMAKGRKEGVNHDIRASWDQRLTNRMNMLASYTGRKFADRGFEHFGQVQMRAVF